MNKRANLYFAALLGAMSPLSTVTALAAQSNSAIATATQQQNSCKGTKVSQVNKYQLACL